MGSLDKGEVRTVTDWSRIPDAEPFPGAGDKWWGGSATQAEKTTLEWIQAHAPLTANPPQVGHDGLIVRPGTTLPEWQYRLKYPKKNPRYRKLGL